MEPHHLHVLTLAWYGLDNGARGDWPPKERETLRDQLGHLFVMKPQAVMLWLSDNRDSPGAKEQEADLLAWLQAADDPVHAAAGVLNQIWAVQRSKHPILSTVSD